MKKKSMKINEVVIVSAARTPVGSFNGSLSQIAAPRLGALAIAAALKRANIKGEEISEVLMGCVLTAGLGQAPARQAAIFSGIPASVPCTTIGKVCGSGLKSIALGRQAILAGEASIVVAGGMENMSLAPHLLEKSRGGYRLGHAEVSDSMVKDGLWDVYNQFHMGNAAELCVKKYKFSREAQDEYAIESYKRALQAQKEGHFKEEIIPIPIKDKKTEKLMDYDEEPLKAKLDKISQLKPVFDRNGSVTAANASTLNDGAAAVILMSAQEARKRGLKPLAKIRAYAEAAQAPEWFTTAPVQAIQKVLNKTKLKTKDIDLYEINEAFAAVTMAAMKELSLDHTKVNIHGGAVALGHPIGASGARILTTLIYAMKQRQARRGLASLCIGGGEANAMIIERV